MAGVREMGAVLRASGEAGELRVGYQVAARLGDWEVLADAAGPRILRAVVVSEHKAWVGHRPLDLVLMLGRTLWVWRGLRPVVCNGMVEVELSERPEVTEHAQLAT